jgi:hypothetical protein
MLWLDCWVHLYHNYSYIGIIPINEMTDDIYSSTYSRSTGKILSNSYMKEIMNTTTMPTLPIGNIIYVNMSGNDNNTGSIDSPFLTIIAAMNSIQDASPNRRYQISIGPGNYAESVTIKANVFLTGTAPVPTSIVFANTLDPTWSNDGDNRSGMSNIEVTNDVTIDFLDTNSSEGRFYLFQCRVGGVVTYGASNSDNQFLIFGSQLLGGLVQIGGIMGIYSTTLYDNTVIQSPISTSDIYTITFACGGGNTLPLDGTTDVPQFSITNQGGTTPQMMLVNLAAFSITGNLSIVGDGNPNDTIVYALATSIPPPDMLSVTNAGQLVLGTYSNAIGYTPSLVTNWLYPRPTTVTEALDTIATTLAFLNGGPI